MNIEENIIKIKKEITQFCSDQNIDSKITIVAAVKTQPIENITLIKNLLEDIGENRVQEFLSHYDSKLPFKWHFIGSLQTNKVKYLIDQDKNVLIHSVDRIHLAEEIDKISLKNKKITDCLIEVNMGGEITKSGLDPDYVVDFIKVLQKYENIRIRGLMTVMPKDPQESQKYYIKLNQLYSYVKTIDQNNLKCDYLSAGMSNDYLTAIKNGANIVRLGTAIFGERNYLDKNT